MKLLTLCAMLMLCVSCEENSVGHTRTEIDTVFVFDTLIVRDTIFPMHFDKTIGTPFNEFAYSVAPTDDGGFMIIGSSDAPSMGVESNLYLVKTNGSGDTLWTRTYSESTDEESRKMIKKTIDGGFIVAFTTYYGPIKGRLLRIAATGDTIWTRSYASSFSSVHPLADGGFIAVGGNLTRCNWLGDTLWTRPFKGIDVKPTYDGGFVITGSTYPSDYLLTKVDANGTLSFQKNYGVVSPMITYVGNSIIQTTDNGFFIVGGYANLSGPPQRAIYAVRADANGDSLWTSTISAAVYDEANCAIQVADGFVTAGNWGADCFVMKHNSNGTHQWTFKKANVYAYSIINIFNGFVVAGFNYNPFDVRLFCIAQNQ